MAPCPPEVPAKRMQRYEIFKASQHHAAVSKVATTLNRLIEQIEAARDLDSATILRLWMKAGVAPSSDEPEEEVRGAERLMDQVDGTIEDIGGALWTLRVLRDFLANGGYHRHRKSKATPASSVEADACAVVSGEEVARG